MKNKRLYLPPHSKIKGFSLIEFLVASLLSMIVLLAVSSSYFTSRTLNNAAASRLNVQQQVRNAANMIVRDARMAGSFGCFNLTNPDYTTANVVTDSGSGGAFSLAASGRLAAVKESPVAGLGLPAGVRGNALIFQYGVDEANPSQSVAIASSCHTIAKPGTKISDLSEAKTVLKISGNEQDGNISILRHVVSAYAVGTINGQTGLFRFQLANNGDWGNPQLLVKDVTNMQTRFLYVTGCPDSIPDTAASAPQETFDYETFNSNKAPAMVNIRLNNGTINAAADSQVQVYNINATVRGGNVCADRSI